MFTIVEYASNLPTLCEPLGSPSVAGGIRVANFYSFMCCFLICLSFCVLFQMLPVSSWLSSLHYPFEFLKPLLHNLKLRRYLKTIVNLEFINVIQWKTKYKHCNFIIISRSSKQKKDYWLDRATLRYVVIMCIVLFAYFKFKP